MIKLEVRNIQTKKLKNTHLFFDKKELETYLSFFIYFINPDKMIDLLIKKEIPYIANDKFIYNIGDINNFKLKVYINMDSSGSELDFKNFLKEKLDNDYNIFIDEKELEKKDGKYKFEFISFENRNGEEIKIWK